MASVTDERRKLPRIGGVLAVVVGLPVLYVLSIGPAFAAMEHRHLSPRTYEVVYCPLLSLSEYSYTCNSVLARYQEFWFPTPPPNACGP